MLEKTSIDKNLKNTDSLKWTGVMNNYKNLAEKVIYNKFLTTFLYFFIYIFPIIYSI